MEDLDAASLEDVQRWYRAFYGPDNCVLSLAGDITAERALELVTRYFGSIPPGPTVDRLERRVPALASNVRDAMADQVPQTAIVRAWHAPAWRDADAQRLELFADVLSGSPSARLDRQLVDEGGLATRVSARVETSELAGLLIVTADLRDGVDPARAEAEMDRVIAGLAEQGPGDEELQRAQSRILARHVRGAERLGGFGGRSDILAESMTFDRRPDGYLDRLERLATSSAADVKAASQRWLRAPHYTLVVEPAAELRPAPVAIDRRVLPALEDPPEVAFPPLQRATLPNGLKIILLERRGAPLVNVSLAVDAGYAADSPGTAGLASLALAVLDEGTMSRDAYGIVDALDALGASISTASSLDLSFVRLQALADRVGPALDIFADVVLRASFPEDRVTIAKTQRLATIAQERATPVAAAQRILPGLLFGREHGYGLPLTGSGFERTVSALTREDLAAWHRAWFHPANATVIVTGETTLQAIVPELARVFGSWQAGQPPAKRITRASGPTAGRVYLVDRPGAQQSVIVAAHLSEPGGAPEDLAIETVMRNFGGMSTSRLNRNLRLDKHWSYGTQAALVGARGQRPLLVIAPVQTDKTKESIVEVRKELADVAGVRPIQGEEYASIMRTQTLGLPGRWATLAALESAAIQIVNYGYPDDYFATYSRRVRELDEAELAAAAARVIRPDAVIWVIVGDLAQIEAGVRELNLGEVSVLESEEPDPPVSP
jgi:zinc protease